MAEQKDIIEEIATENVTSDQMVQEEQSMQEADLAPEKQESQVVSKYDRLMGEESVKKLTGMYKNWFLDYASYVILERAVPHIDDGLKPVQRRILHTMKKHCAEGVRTKVQSIVGDVMKYHPHGDASIKDALVQLGQKGLLIDTQGDVGVIV